MTILYFSATGNSLAVAKKIGGELLSIPKLIKENRYEINDDIIGVITPTYCADAPKMVREYLSKAKLTAEYTFVICTYGYIAGAVTSHMREYMEITAGHTDYDAKIIMVDTALTLCETQKQIDTLPKKDVEGQIRKVSEDIAARKKNTTKVSAFHKGLDWFYHAAGGYHIAADRDKDFRINDACIKCGICFVDSDDYVHPDYVKYLHHCEGCLACLNACPKNAIHLKNEKSSVRFRNADVTLQEIIDGQN